MVELILKDRLMLKIVKEALRCWVLVMDYIYRLITVQVKSRERAYMRH